MHLTALVESAEHVCCRYRLVAFRDLLQRAGHSLELKPWPRRWWSWLCLRRELANADAVILQRKLLQHWQLFLLRLAARLLIYDFDDAVFLRDSYSPRGLSSTSRQRRFAAVVRAADAIAAGNAFLAEQAARWTDASRVHVIPTCVDPARYPLAEHFGDGLGPEEAPTRERRTRTRRTVSTAVHLVWVGSASTLRGLQVIQPILEETGKAVPGLRLKMICDRFLNLRHLPIVPCPWTEAGEAEELASADVGISWMPDDPWSQGKCGLKVLQYMAAGLPVVANPVGMHSELVRHGENGFLVRTPSEWVEAVWELVHNPGLRRCMGEEGRRRVEEEFSTRVGAGRWADLLNSVPCSVFRVP